MERKVKDNCRVKSSKWNFTKGFFVLKEVPVKCLKRLEDTWSNLHFFYSNKIYNWSECSWIMDNSRAAERKKKEKEIFIVYSFFNFSTEERNCWRLARCIFSCFIFFLLLLGVFSFISNLFSYAFYSFQFFYLSFMHIFLLHFHVGGASVGRWRKKKNSFQEEINSWSWNFSSSFFFLLFSKTSFSFIRSCFKREQHI